jgi:hypothetical protein
LWGINDPECVFKAVEDDTDIGKCGSYPKVASNIVWELIKNINGTTDYGVKVSYNGVYVDWCKNKQKDKKEQFYCTLAEFTEASNKHYIYKDYSKTCGW